MATKQKLMKYTDEQDAALNALTEAAGKTYADLVRGLLAAEAERRGIVWPDNMPTREETIKKAYSNRWPKEPRTTLTRRNSIYAGMTFTQGDTYELKDCEKMSVREFAEEYADMRRQCRDCAVFVYAYVDGQRVRNWREIIDLANIDAMESVDLEYFKD